MGVNDLPLDLRVVTDFGGYGGAVRSCRGVHGTGQTPRESERSGHFGLTPFSPQAAFVILFTSPRPIPKAAPSEPATTHSDHPNRPPRLHHLEGGPRLSDRPQACNRLNARLAATAKHPLRPRVPPQRDPGSSWPACQSVVRSHSQGAVRSPAPRAAVGQTASSWRPPPQPSERRASCKYYARESARCRC